jgi:FlaA1/EpsC-like NDP-sugar epimerase
MFIPKWVFCFFIIPLFHHSIIPIQGGIMNLNLKDKVVLVTGSAGGVGRKIAFAFAAEGAKVVVNYRKKDKLESSKAAEEVVSEIKKTYGTDH